MQTLKNLGTRRSFHTHSDFLTPHGVDGGRQRPFMLSLNTLLIVTLFILYLITLKNVSHLREPVESSQDLAIGAK